MAKEKKDLIVFGGSGLVGAAVVREAKKRNLTFIGSYRKRPSDGLFYWDGDITSIKKLIDELDPGAIIFTVGMTNVDVCEIKEKEAYLWNADIPSEIASLCGRFCKFVYYSSEYVFDGEKGPYSEIDSPTPMTIYGRSKLQGEKNILSVNPYSLILRTTVVYGPELNGKNFVASLRKKLTQDQSVKVACDQVSSPTYNQDLAARTLDLIKLKKHGIWNVVGPELMDRASFAFLAAEIFNLDKKLIIPSITEHLNQAAKRPLNAGLRTDKLNILFDQEYMHSPREGLLLYKQYENE